jgi:Holliday junction resolvase RusA-like endonuclease
MPDAREVRFELPYPPSANRYWRSDRGGRPHLHARAAGLTPLEGPVRLTLIVFRPRRAGDLSNRIKVLEDALNGIAYADDGQVVELHAYLRDDKHRPRVELSLRALPAQTPQQGRLV